MYVIQNKYTLANYIEEKYQEIYSKKITPLKLQKSLYFLFGYYILEKGENDDFLFNANFQAWKYGPIEKDVYYNKKDYINKETISGEVKYFIDNYLNNIFNVSDFNLINISHTHNCWKNVYQNMKSNPISHEEIRKTFLELANKKR